MIEQYTYVQHVQSKSVIKATSNYDNNITGMTHPQRSYTSMIVKFTCTFAAFCAIVRSNIVYLIYICFISYRMRLVKLIERFSLPVIIFSSAHAAQTAVHN